MNIAMVGSARAASSSIVALGEMVRGVVVEVRSGAMGAGTGIIWGGAGLVVTNAHVAPRGPSIEVDVAGRRHDATLVAHHEGHDLALVAAPAVRGPLLELRDAKTLRPGELVFAHGHPLGQRDALAMGVVHAVVLDERTGVPRWVVANVRLAPGNSGGPLVDAEGRLVGINSMVVNGLGLAVPATLVERFVERALMARAA